MSGDLLAPIQQHGILRERLAELATDAYRAQMLDACGYRSQVVEFIDLEHTARNLLIRAVRRPHGSGSTEALATARQLADQFGVRNPVLETLLNKTPEEPQQP